MLRITGQVLFCFTSDPFPTGVKHDHAIDMVLETYNAGYDIVILTKNPVDCMRYTEQLLFVDAWMGTTITCGNMMSLKEEPGAPPTLERLSALKFLSEKGLRTWVSVEPVLDPYAIEGLVINNLYVNIWKFGKLNHVQNNTDWVEYGEIVEKIVKENKLKRYMIKDDLWNVRSWGIPKQVNSEFDSR